MEVPHTLKTVLPESKNVDSEIVLSVGPLLVKPILVEIFFLGRVLVENLLLEVLLELLRL